MQLANEWHRGRVGIVFASQLQGALILNPGYSLCGISHLLPESVWVSSGLTGFLHVKKHAVLWIASYKLPLYTHYKRCILPLHPVILGYTLDPLQS